MDKIAVCALFKDEAPYLLEWLAFHRMIGVDLSGAALPQAPAEKNEL